MTQLNQSAAELDYAEAAQLFQGGHLPLAEARLKRWLDADIPDARIHALAGFIRLKAGHADGAIAALTRALSLIHI